MDRTQEATIACRIVESPDSEARQADLKMRWQKIQQEFEQAMAIDTLMVDDDCEMNSAGSSE